MDSLLVAIVLSMHAVPAPVVRDVAILPPPTSEAIQTRDEIAATTPDIWDVEGER